MTFGSVVKAFDTVMALRAVAKRMTGGDPPAREGVITHPSAMSGLAGQLEARLTNVVVAALKEAFERDHARLEIERAQLEEQRRRAEEAMRLEIRRQAVDREIARLRMLAMTALVGWVASVAIFVARIGAASVPSRAVMAVGWLLLLGALASAFTAQGRIGSDAAGTTPAPDSRAPATATLWLLTFGLGVSAISLMF